MRLETDIQRIKQRARQEEERNWTFRCFLKGCDLSAKEIDSVVHALNKEVSSQIDCTNCGNCCKVVQPVLKSRDIKRLARYLNLPEEVLRAQYLQKDDEKQGDIFKVRPCRFYKRIVVRSTHPDLTIAAHIPISTRGTLSSGLTRRSPTARSVQ